MQEACEHAGLEVRMQTAIKMEQIAEPYINRKAVRHLEKGRVVIFAAGTGNPFFTTDSAATLRALEVGCDAVLKATKVDGIYTADPFKDPNAKRYEEITYSECLSKQLKIMDSTAFSMANDNNMPIIVFNFSDKENLKRVLAGDNSICSLVKNNI
jgi:uridylate kinase